MQRLLNSTVLLLALVSFFTHTAHSAAPTIITNEFLSGYEEQVTYGEAVDIYLEAERVRERECEQLFPTMPYADGKTYQESAEKRDQCRKEYEIPIFCEIAGIAETISLHEVSSRTRRARGLHDEKCRELFPRSLRAPEFGPNEDRDSYTWCRKEFTMPAVLCRVDFQLPKRLEQQARDAANATAKRERQLLEEEMKRKQLEREQHALELREQQERREREEYETDSKSWWWQGHIDDLAQQEDSCRRRHEQCLVQKKTTCHYRH